MVAVSVKRSIVNYCLADYFENIFPKQPYTIPDNVMTAAGFCEENISRMCKLIYTVM